MTLSGGHIFEQGHTIRSGNNSLVAPVTVHDWVAEHLLMEAPGSLNAPGGFGP